MQPGDIGPHPAVPEAYTVLGRPKTMTDAECIGLPVRYGLLSFESGDALAYVSEWPLTDEERALIAAGASIRLRIVGASHPPVAMWVKEPNEV